MTSARRLTFAAISGAIWGLGVAVLLQQFSIAPLGLPTLYGLPVAGGILSVLWVRRSLSGSTATAMLVMLVVALPVMAFQGSGCAVEVVSGGDVGRDLSATRIGDPIVVGEDDASIEIFVSGPASDAEASAWVEIGRIKITPSTWTEGFSDGTATFRVDRDESPIGSVPGIYRVGAGVAGGCSVDGYVRIEGNPLTGPVGQAAVAAILLGLAGTWWVGRPDGASPTRSPEPPGDGEAGPSADPSGATVPGVRTPYVTIDLVDPSTGLGISPTVPLVAGATYLMTVRVNPPGPVAAGGTVPLTVLTTSRDADVEAITHALPGTDGGTVATIPITPRTAGEPATIDVDLMYRGHLLQSQRLTARVADGSAPESGEAPVRSEDTTFTASDFDPVALAALPARHATLILRHDERDGSVDCEVILADHEGVVTRSDTVNPKEELLSASARVRERLRAMIEDDASGYRTVLRADTDRLDLWLPVLADIGHSLYLTMLDPEGIEGAAFTDAVQFGSVIQVNQVAAGLGKATVPWALLYEPEIDYRPGVTTVCPDHATHGPERCPHADDPTIVCPWGFWGYRYVLEQPPGWRGDRDDLPGLLVRSVDNERPLQVSAAVNTTLERWQPHLDALSEIGDVDVHTVATVPGLLELWERLGDRIDLAYFYVHAGAGRSGAGHHLSLADGPIGRNSLRSWRTRLGLTWDHAPLVILNGCGTGDYGPAAYSSLINEFRSYGASGVVGTECVVSEAVAGAYVTEMLGRLAAGEPLGPLMLDMRRRFLTEWNNPAALVYTLYAPSDIRLGVPVTGPATPGEEPT